ncbi:hypothetical protein DH2020_019236 [Rehmannia glutinosa]|uniref:LOB domain-containing protein n=1 Tax=Rehmannia glutinosa TaxID=99300 RepID=A0ABR0WQ84_REHGL
MASSSSYNPPCAACKFLRRKCMRGCIFAPYFPPEEPQKFANVHKIFGASNVAKLLNELLPHQRRRAPSPSSERQVERLEKELDAANDLIRFACNEFPAVGMQPTAAPQAVMVAEQRPVELNGRIGNERGGGRFYQTPGVPFPYSNDIYNPNGGGLMDGSN